MAIIEDENTESGPIVNTDKIIQLISSFKFPLILIVVGIIFMGAGIMYLVKTQGSGEVIFSSDATSSAEISKGKFQVDIEGAVMTPGVYEVREGSRIIDALASADGFSAEADRDWVSRNMNLAAKVADGGKIYIPSANENIVANSSLSDLSTPSNLLGVTTGKVNINSASQTELENLPGVGPVTAGKIIGSRPYQAIEDLKSKKAVGNALFEKIKDLIVAF